jgi:hypothetical protein
MKRLSIFGIAIVIAIFCCIGLMYMDMFTKPPAKIIDAATKAIVYECHLNAGTASISKDSETTWVSCVLDNKELWRQRVE